MAFNLFSTASLAAKCNLSFRSSDIPERVQATISPLVRCDIIRPLSLLGNTFFSSFASVSVALARLLEPAKTMQISTLYLLPGGAREREFKSIKVRAKPAERKRGRQVYVGWFVWSNAVAVGQLGTIQKLIRHQQNLEWRRRRRQLWRLASQLAMVAPCVDTDASRRSQYWRPAWQRPLGQPFEKGRDGWIAYRLLPKELPLLLCLFDYLSFPIRLPFSSPQEKGRQAYLALSKPENVLSFMMTMPLLTLAQSAME